MIDKESVVSSIKRSPFVFSFNSTILFESSLVDRIPIIINNHSFSLSGFPVKYNMIDLKEDLEIQLKNIFQLQKQSNDSRDEINWVKLIEEELTNE